jgi:hypothetical protein
VNMDCVLKHISKVKKLQLIELFLICNEYMFEVINLFVTLKSILLFVYKHIYCLSM